MRSLSRYHSLVGGTMHYMGEHTLVPQFISPPVSATSELCLFSRAGTKRRDSNDLDF